MIYLVLRKEAEKFVSGKKVDRKWKKERISGREAARQLGVDNHTFKKWISLMEEAV